MDGGLLLYLGVLGGMVGRWAGVFRGVLLL